MYHIGEGDIGFHLPDNAPTLIKINLEKLLAIILEMVQNKSYEAGVQCLFSNLS
ncbi:hypothetical protein BN1058_02931 [Paraliobacillus sp. PM-2]|uniref:2-C-methyl-D-erythritol 2,4-cyclodiphosphate synthase n=1 Tax=Paraliobacillus sp. PM-2 TaxID=1462524 RepID=UPI00061CBA3B|nr:2-C-methyl-D-erythritol 2,4-cyclodiphosphate synthase [Paraliobacillus sp. PM-2]CQR48547.1 hypothetical protein BN1058_02931 [Paraliobacillus sp. PM-2]